MTGFKKRELAGFADAKDTNYAGAPLPRTWVDPKQSIPSTNRPPSRRQGTLPARRNDR